MCLLWFRGMLGAANYEQTQGPARLVVQAPKLEAGRIEMRLSDDVVVTLSVEAAGPLEVEPIARVTPSRDWQVTGRAEPARLSLPEGQSHWQQSFHLEPVKPGELTLVLAPLRIRASPASDTWQEITWKPIPVRVTTEVLVPDRSELRDVAPPEEVPPAPPWWEPFAWPTVVLLMALLTWVAWQRYRRRMRHQTVSPPDQWALGQLERLEKQARAEGLEAERFYTLLSDIVRKYLELRFHLPALEQTTVEFLEGMRQAPQLTAAQQATLRTFLEQCDLVKFARAAPAEDERHAILQTARGFIEGTAPPIHDRLGSR